MPVLISNALMSKYALLWWSSGTKDNSNPKFSIATLNEDCSSLVLWIQFHFEGKRMSIVSYKKKKAL